MVACLKQKSNTGCAKWLYQLYPCVIDSNHPLHTSLAPKAKQNDESTVPTVPTVSSCLTLDFEVCQWSILEVV